MTPAGPKIPFLSRVAVSNVLIALVTSIWAAELVSEAIELAVLPRFGNCRHRRCWTCQDASPEPAWISAS